MKLYLQLFWSFFKIGAFTLGGGYAMIPLIEQEVVGRRRWISSEEFSETLTLAQSAPGPISVNSAVFVGYKMRGMKGVLMTVLGTVVPSFVVILVIAMFFSDIRNNEVVERIFSGLRPAVVALIAVPVVNMLKKKNFAWKIVSIAIISAIAVAWLKISPIVVIITAGIGGLIYYFIRKKHD
ncbi:MAG: chromate transporter [Tannerella sp.]|nr:chromate transporter [Tannerella sp.]